MGDRSAQRSLLATTALNVLQRNGYFICWHPESLALASTRAQRWPTASFETNLLYETSVKAMAGPLLFLSKILCWWGSKPQHPLIVILADVFNSKTSRAQNDKGFAYHRAPGWLLPSARLFMWEWYLWSPEYRSLCARHWANTEKVAIPVSRNLWSEQTSGLSRGERGTDVAKQVKWLPWGHTVG